MDRRGTGAAQDGRQHPLFAGGNGKMTAAFSWETLLGA